MRQPARILATTFCVLVLTSCGGGGSTSTGGAEKVAHTIDARAKELGIPAGELTQDDLIRAAAELASATLRVSSPRPGSIEVADTSNGSTTSCITLSSDTTASAVAEGACQ